jgi:hypothetical protein
MTDPALKSRQTAIFLGSQSKDAPTEVTVIRFRLERAELTASGTVSVFGMANGKPVEVSDMGVPEEVADHLRLECLSQLKTTLDAEIARLQETTEKSVAAK